MKRTLFLALLAAVGLAGCAADKSDAIEMNPNPPAKQPGPAGVPGNANIPPAAQGAMGKGN